MTRQDTHGPIVQVLPSVSIHLSINRVVFLVTELQDLPPLDTEPIEQCKMRFRMMPGLLLVPPDATPPIIYPFLLDHSALSFEVQLLSAAVENENPFYGLAAFARILTAPDYVTHVPERLSAYLPYELVARLFPTETTAALAKLDPPDSELPASAPVQLNFQLALGGGWPQLHAGKIVRLSLNLYTSSGSLALNGQELLINSRSHPTFIHLGPSGFAPVANDYYQLHGLSSDLPTTCSLPRKYPDYTEMLDPSAAIIARVSGVKT